MLCLTKGVELTSGLLMTEVIGDEIGHPERIAALSGPNHAEEICRGGLSAAVIASEDPEVAEFFKAAHDLAHAHGALLIADEVQTGVFRSGKPLRSRPTASSRIS